MGDGPGGVTAEGPHRRAGNGAKPRAIVIGGSLGGLFAATMLREVCGWEVDVFERVENDLASRGAGIATHDEMFDVLRRVGLSVDESFGIDVTTRICFGKSGEIIYEYPMRRKMSAWARFYRPLKDHFPHDRYHFSKTLTRVEQHADGVSAVFSDGKRIDGDLLIGADGFRSTVRESIMPEVQPAYAGYIAWRGMVEEGDLPTKLHSEIFERRVEGPNGAELHMLHAYGLPEGQFMTIYPVPGHDNDLTRGRRRSNFVWYHPLAEAGVADLCTDASGYCHGTAIAPHLIRPEKISHMRALARELFAPQIAELVHLAKQPFFQAIFDMESPSVVRGRVALLGDAAFVARPHVGMGTTKAALDARYLAEAILGCGADLEPALRQYDAACRKFGGRVVARGRWLGAHLEAQVRKSRAERTSLELNHIPFDTLFREVGAALSDIPELAELTRGDEAWRTMR
jgi:2-polyprenyl-6-methoxyphenol hydroxylase-like FAD-dependent oxidoreductase